MQEINKKIFGAEVIEATGRVHGLNAEGEVCGSYRPTRHPGVRARPFEIASASILMDVPSYILRPCRFRWTYSPVRRESQYVEMMRP